MTERGKHVLRWLGFSGFVSLIGCAMAFAVARYQLNEKVDRSEFREHIVTDSVQGAELKRTLRRIDSRVSAIYCGQVPEPNRAGCQ